MVLQKRVVKKNVVKRVKKEKAFDPNKEARR